MKLTKKQAAELLLDLQSAVQAQIDRWEAERRIENALGKEFDGMGDPIECMAVGYDSGSEVTIEDVIAYVADLEEGRLQTSFVYHGAQRPQRRSSRTRCSGDR